jgi:hypothetical protein
LRLRKVQVKRVCWTVKDKTMWCSIRIQGHLSAQWTGWLGGLSIENQADGEAVLSGELADQRALHGILGRLRDMGIVLLALECRDPERAACERKARPGAQPC